MSQRKCPYDEAILEIIKLSAGDVIATSVPSDSGGDADEVEGSLSP